MKPKYVVFSIIDLVVWYLFAAYIIYVLQNLPGINLWVAALILVVLGTAGTFLCPWLLNTDGWKRLIGKE